VELAVKRDIKAMGARPGRGTLAALALVLARAIDDGPAPSMVSKMVSELRACMTALGKGGGDDGDDDAGFGVDMSTPVRDS
jgi:hypothetical protein